ncbi:L,D-transpeptidase [Curtobacterium sp. MCBD17_013]|uniref:L,D-transpeptidase n=1 Tax=Curtobacterium sp. MCBD17_013 TaxID=2175668 RepID=UPI0021ABF148|nr:L,D-transpeptidase [Curtobacterium sp. MCBD17_013]
MLRRLAPVTVAAVTATLLLAGCSGAHPHHARAGHTPTPTPTVHVGGALGQRPTASPSPSADATAPSIPPIAASATVATAEVASVAVHAAAAGAVTTTLPNPQSNGAPLVFLVVAQQSGWVEVDVPTRPNGRTGWVRASDVALSTVAYHLVAVTETNTLTVYRAGRPVATYPVASGTGGTPTPHGSFYLTELLKPTNAGYGPYAYGLSAFSDVLTSFGGGPGQIGLHGTDDASSIGKDASHGCIRMQNADITALTKLLPLGTPITII